MTQQIQTRPFLRRRQAHALQSARLAAERREAPVSVTWAEPPPVRVAEGVPLRGASCAAEGKDARQESRTPTRNRRPRRGNAG